MKKILHKTRLVWRFLSALIFGAIYKYKCNSVTFLHILIYFTHFNLLETYLRDSKHLKSASESNFFFQILN